MNCLDTPDPRAPTVECAVSANETRVREFEPFRETLEWLSVLPKKSVLAGGCIRDMWIDSEAKITDYDVFVLGVQEDEAESFDKILKGHYTETVLGNTEQEDWAQEAAPYKGMSGGGPFHFPRTNVILPWVPNGKLTQIMYSPAKTMDELVQRFDWRVCAFAFDGETVISSGEADFTAGKLSLQDAALRSPRSTLRRGFRLEDKYRGTTHFLKLPNDLILALASMLVLNGDGKTQEV